MNTGHTPGKWTCEHSGFGDYIVHQDCGDWKNKDGSKFTSRVRERMSLADARLIAASPDLLAALKDARQVLETARQYFPKSIRNSDRFRLLNVLANAVKPAIENAEGKEG